MATIRILLISGLALLTFLGISLLDLSRPLWYVRLTNLYRDALSRAGRTTAANPDLVFLAIDANSVSLDETDIHELYGLTGNDSDSARALRLMTKRYPWSREVYALALQRLVEAGARVVAFDVIFPGPAEDDPLFRAALERHADRVVIGSNFVDQSLTRPTDALIPQTAPIDRRVGFTNFWADDDDVVRCARFQVTFAQLRGDLHSPDPEEFSSLAAAVMSKAGFAQDVPAGLGNHQLRFTGEPRRGFVPHSLFEIFVPDYWRQNYQSGKFFRDKIVIVGAEGNWQHDDHPTPFGNMPGAELHLNAINAALHHEFVRELPLSAGIFFTGLAGFVAILQSLLVRSPWLRIAGLVACCVGGVGLSLICFNHGAFYLPMVAPLGQLTATMLLGMVCDLTSERMEKAQVRRVLERYVSREVVSEMVDRPNLYAQSLGGVIKPVAILFSDIRGYSLMSAKSNPHEVVNQLNEYLGAMVECVFRFGGTLDKFIGDAVMAVWGNIHTEGAAHDAGNAVRAALAMQKELVRLNERWLAKGWPQLRTGIAIHHGEVVVGNIGSPQRMEFTVIGDAVNITWKLQELTKELGCDFIVSEHVQAVIDRSVGLRSLGLVDLPSLKEPLELFTLASSTSEFSPRLSAERVSHALSYRIPAR